MIPLIVNTRTRQSGFALPSVLIASVVMLIVLVTAAAAVSTARSALNTQYYNQLAKEAAESGITMAEQCVNDGVSAWADPLRPGSDCAGAPAQCADANCYVVYDTDTNVRSTFQVNATATASGISLDATGTVELLRQGTSSVWKTYTQVLRADVGAEPLNTTSVTSGLYQVCAVLSAQTWCNGGNQSGQMGNGRVEPLSEALYLAPERVMREPGALRGKEDKFVRSGNQAACTVTTDNEIYCWGSDGYGMLGIGDYPRSPYVQPVPTRVQKPAGMTGEITDLALSHHGGCAIADGNLWCWGRDHIGQTGIGGTDRSEKRTPLQTAVIGASRGIPVTDIASHVYAYHYCAVAGGEVYCWGDDSLGQLGDNTAKVDRTVPTLVHQASGGLQGKTVVKVEVSRSIRMHDGRWNVDGEGPAGSYCDGRPWVRNCYLQTHACALTSDGQMYCWGRNHYGQLGQGSWDYDTHLPVRVRGALEGKFVRDIATSYHSSCALTDEPDTGDRFYCWGSNYGGVAGLGHNLRCDNSPASEQAICSPQPVVMETPGLQNKHIESISGGVNRTCAVAEGVSYCMGINTQGQLGDGTTTNRDRPTEAKLFRQYRPLLVY